ncbi:MAG: sulfite oxidase-like oxidoreductase [Chloroflexi bacterium]|nr:sulfite oxidase-like oxidoreductase [Chloroflexota bacterium]
MLFKRPDQVKKAPPKKDVPPGQFLTEKFPVLTYGPAQKIDLKEWRLRAFGLVDNEIELNWEEFSELPWSTVEAPFHCVTQWSKMENTWEGLLFTDLAAIVKPKDEAKFVIAHCYGDYTTNLPLEVLMDGMSLLAHKHDGEPLTAEHGGPLRLVVPQRYGWKSAKWLRGIEFIAEDRPGFWEVRGYHNNADFWKEERFWPELS